MFLSLFVLHATCNAYNVKFLTGEKTLNTVSAKTYFPSQFQEKQDHLSVKSIRAKLHLILLCKT